MTDIRDQLQASLAGRYEIEREIGHGGMATVYLAHDIKHARHVALKLLDPELGAVLGADRFLSEIRVTANLQHPNILPLFDSGEAKGLLYYVMPYVEDETLRQRIDREQQLPIDDAVRIAIAVAGALDYAHERGVIHRDLKPENILLQHGQPVVADFGIALAVSKAGGQRVTQTGLSLGTPQYMSPEQATGDRVIDGRSDIYSLGAVTYEMLAGEPPHSGSNAQAIMARLMTEEPRPLSSVRRTVPEHVEDAVHTALEKMPADRFTRARDFADALRGIGAGTHSRSGARANAQRRPASKVPMVAAIAASALALILAVLLYNASTRTTELPTTRFEVSQPAGQRVAIAQSTSIVLSPDGRTIAYVANEPSGTRQIYVRRLDSLAASLLPNGEGYAPLFSPDGRWLAFKTNEDLRRVSLEGGPVEIIAPIAQWQGYTWGSDGDIVYASRGSLWRVGPSSTKPTRLTVRDSAAGELSHANPLFIDRETIAFMVQRPTANGTTRGIGLVSRDGGTHALLDIPGDAPLGYVEGHLLLGDKGGSIVAFPVDLKKKVVTGPPVTLVDSVVFNPAGGLQASLAADGTLAYLRGSSGSRLAIVDAHGVTIAESPEARNFSNGVISPDGKRVAATLQRELIGTRDQVGTDTWIWDVDAKTITRFTTDGGSQPRWSPDGKRLAFSRLNAGSTEVWSAPIDGSAAGEKLVRLPTRRSGAFDFVPAGRYLVAAWDDSTTRDDVYLIDLTMPDAAPTPLAHTKFRERTPAVSPDSKWLAYQSDETGRFEIYVRPLFGNVAPVRITTGGSSTPAWATGGRRIMYSAGGKTLAVTLEESGQSVRAARVDTVLSEPIRGNVDPRTDHIILNREPESRRIVVVTNWLAEARAKLRER